MTKTWVHIIFMAATHSRLSGGIPCWFPANIDTAYVRAIFLPSTLHVINVIAYKVTTGYGPEQWGSANVKAGNL